ncbi:hypothetical protein D3C80_1642600 [compost metagenome]
MGFHAFWLQADVVDLDARSDGFHSLFLPLHPDLSGLRHPTGDHLVKLSGFLLRGDLHGHAGDSSARHHATRQPTGVSRSGRPYAQPACIVARADSITVVSTVHAPHPRAGSARAQLRRVAADPVQAKARRVD